MNYNQIFKDTKDTLDNELESNRFKFADSLIQKKDSILDIGCANGNLMKHLTKEVSYFGLDISSKAIEDNPFPSIVSDAEEFKLDKKFDIIVCLEVLEHINNPKKALKNMFDHLRKDGLILVTVPKGKLLPDKTHLHIFNFEYINLLCREFTKNYRIVPIKKYDKDEYERLFSVVMAR